jgi:hypothetical protein
VIAYYKGRLVADGNAIRQHCDEKRRLQQEVQRLRTQVGTQAPNIRGLVLNFSVENGQIVYRSGALTPATALAPPPLVAPAPPVVAPVVAPAAAPALNTHRQFRRFHRRDVEVMLNAGSMEVLDYMVEREHDGHAGSVEFYYMETRSNGYFIDVASRVIYYRTGNIYKRFSMLHEDGSRGHYRIPIYANQSDYEFVNVPHDIVYIEDGQLAPQPAAPAPTTRINPTVVSNPLANRAGVNATTRQRQPDWVETGSARRWCNCRHCPTMNRTSRTCSVYNCNKHACRSCERCEAHNPDYNQPIPN